MHTHNGCDKLTNIIHCYTYLQLDRPAVAHAALKRKVLNSSISNNTQGEIKRHRHNKVDAVCVAYHASGNCSASKLSGIQGLVVHLDHFKAVGMELFI